MRSALVIAATLAFALSQAQAHAGGSGLNVAVVVNQASSNSVELGNFYSASRAIPPENLVRISWPGGNTTWARSEFESLLLNPLLAAMAQRGLTGQIHYVVLSMDIPFAVAESGRVNSTTSCLFYGFKDDTMDKGNSYAGSEGAFGEVVPDNASGESFLATMITAGSLEQAKFLIEQGVNGDATDPTQTVFLAKSSDQLRNIRHTKFDNTIFSTRVDGWETVERINSNVVAGRSNLLGFQTGLANFSISPHTFVPGAMADSMTSYGGVIFGPNSQTSLLAFIHAGAAGSYGTVTEPGVAVSKFPDPQVYFYQTRGFSLGECYYQAVQSPYQGLIVGEPLAAPYRHAATGTWIGVSSNAVLRGTPQLSVQFTASDPVRPLQQVDLFVDGKYFKTLTNLPPTPGNQLQLRFAGGQVNYTVPGNATLSSIASGLAAAINSVAASSPANITATPHGDRIEVRSLAGTRPRPPRLLAVSTTQPADPPPMSSAAPLASSSIGAGAFLSTFLRASRESSLESSAFGSRRCILAGTFQVGSWLQLSVTKTNGATVAMGVTNQTADATLVDFAGELLALVNSTPDLQGADGLRMEELAALSSAWVSFDFRPRSAGYAAAGVRIGLTASAGLTVSAAAGDLRENLDDLLPRNHVYVRAGAADLRITFPLDSTQLDDGHHELTAVAYEGSHVRTQNGVTLPVVVQNTALSATMTLPASPELLSVGGSYPVEVAANQSDVTAIRLFSTGGELGVVLGRSSATFTVEGNILGIGRHPICAVVETSTGERYRTETRWIRLSTTP